MGMIGRGTWDVVSEDDFDMDDDKPMTVNQIMVIDRLLGRTSCDPKRESAITSYIDNGTPTRDEAAFIIDYLGERQIDAITAGYQYSATDIVNKLRDER